MTKRPGEKKRSRIGVVCSLRVLKNGKCRLYFDDAINDSSSAIDCWNHEESIIFKDYDLATIKHLKLSRNELAEIGLTLINRLLAKTQQKTDRNKLIRDIRIAFKDAEFPSHLGLIAAESIHDWETDQDVLEELTKRHDFHGAWWDVPESHLDRGSLGLYYLNATGMAFYLPAFMTLALQKPRLKYIRRLVGEFDPIQEGEDDNHYSLFCKKLSRIRGQRKEVCIRFMQYMKEVLMLMSHIHIQEVERINIALEHEFWKMGSKKNS